MPDEKNKIRLQIVTPERRVLAEEVDHVQLPSVNGYLGVLPGHAPLLVRLQVGQVTCTLGKEERLMAVSGGYAEVLRDSVTILAETCEPVGEIDVERAKGAQQRAEARLKGQDPDTDIDRARVALLRAVNRISTADRGRGMM
jgi:F-type H+-transporting ATPase subunit epsilon